MKQFLSFAVPPPPGRNVATEVPAAAGPAPIFADLWEASSAELQHGPGADRNRPWSRPHRPAVAPSLRLRVTPANRSLLRWLRAAELAAWQDADVSALRALNLFHPLTKTN